MNMWFDSKTFEDHNGQPSFVRKSLAWILLFGGVLILVGVVMFGLLSLDVSKEMASFIIKALAAMTGVVGIAYGAMQGAKGYAQGQAARGGAAGHQEGAASQPLVRRSQEPSQASDRGAGSDPSGSGGQVGPSSAPKASGKVGT